MMTFHHLSFRQPTPRHVERGLGEALGVSVGEGRELRPETPRALAERQRAFAAVSARYGTRGIGRGWRLGLLALLAAGVAATAFTLSDIGELTPLNEAPAAYETLTVGARQVCLTGTCAFAANPPGLIGDAMTAVGARWVFHDVTYGETTIRGGRRARFDYVRAWLGTQAQVEARTERLRDLGHFEPGSPTLRSQLTHSAGWRRVSRNAQ